MKFLWSLPEGDLTSLVLFTFLPSTKGGTEELTQSHNSLLAEWWLKFKTSDPVSFEGFRSQRCFAPYLPLGTNFLGGLLGSSHQACERRQVCFASDVAFEHC